MEFSIWCPTDGSIDVGLEDIDSVVVRGGSDVEVVFTCPVCGQLISLAAQVPQSLLASLDDVWVRIDGGDGRLITLRRQDMSGEDDGPSEPAQADERVESYCEYFRRELASTDTVEQALVEIDAREVR